MSAISVRVAVVPGRTVIGIELPNRKARDRLSARVARLAGLRAARRRSSRWCSARTSAASRSIADLARMPHLLIAGTTGSGKSVGINTMILSMLYRMPPDRCKFIMIDPKMLELSVYDGIPHLLAPVVTDPKKAVLALKWTVREMENRYREDVEARRAQHRGLQRRGSPRRAKGESLIRKVQTGFDPETGQPIFEEQPFDLEAIAADRRRRRRDGRSDAGRRQGDRGGGPAPGADGARRRHPPHHGDAAPVGRRHHRHDQGQFPDPHQLPGDLEDRQPHDPRREAAPSSCSAAATCSTWPAAAASPACTARSSPTRRSSASSRS